MMKLPVWLREWALLLALAVCSALRAETAGLAARFHRRTFIEQLQTVSLPGVWDGFNTEVGPRWVRVVSVAGLPAGSAFLFPGPFSRVFVRRSCDLSDLECAARMPTHTPKVSAYSYRSSGSLHPPRLPQLGPPALRSQLFAMQIMVHEHGEYKESICSRAHGCLALLCVSCFRSTPPPPPSPPLLLPASCTCLS